MIARVLPGVDETFASFSRRQNPNELRDVALGTVLFGDPGAPERVRSGLEAACAEAGVVKPEDAGSLSKSPETEQKVHA